VFEAKLVHHDLRELCLIQNPRFLCGKSVGSPVGLADGEQAGPREAYLAFRTKRNLNLVNLSSRPPKQFRVFLPHSDGAFPNLKSETESGLFHTLIGSGHLDLNPTIVFIRLEPKGSHTEVFIRAVAKEGGDKAGFCALGG
jgi:hypothetical protein